MFKKFNNKKVFSLLLSLVLVLGMSVTGFAANDNYLIFEVEGETIATSYNEVTVGGVTRRTYYLEFQDDIDLSDVPLKANTYLSGYTLEIDGVSTTLGVVTSVDFSDGYVEFSLDNGLGSEYEYYVNAGVNGVDVLISVSLDIHNVKDWLNGTYDGAFPAPNPNADLALKNRMQDAVDGFDQLPVIMPVLMKVGDSAMDALIEARNIYDFYTVGAESNYISAMGKTSSTTLSAFDINSYSGWMYKMDGEMPNVGAGQYTLTSSDETMEWGFTLDFGQDLGGAPW
ncbi:DUF4430 domain-containing protein [Tissierella sp. MB52-C2]|uniref:DUF4430 domain-containing protein n=1 Tax=Tissierella sp. MB52-C2 TaxID=3070999 RepID=UPI00280B3051|nr:DUF4430 domain-containing protein [Tissierella sp. MB52-C2]WMM25815.1 DUF4430 domain-containing protein [Tissierella sp. MB52-C2]